ncbi:uncharacterized protein PgNI_12047 [Pyricularia grisea]|uniref:Uncharacterized protein n=1 Tax=Pyricularia grisea TaxID=148305 RepID=A0A6P8AQZ6_PYRGI|nr:uncharacterized protein PgNI_12047 [Pyricularia grisea]TLD04485.1 hypothetical protein PgNI_12047 [Pyricularia grisea]
MEGCSGNWCVDMDIDGREGSSSQELLTIQVTTIARCNQSSDTRVLGFGFESDPWLFYLLTLWMSSSGQTKVARLVADHGSILQWTSFEDPPGRTLIEMLVRLDCGRGRDSKGSRTHKTLTNIDWIAMQLGIGLEGMIPDDESGYEDTRPCYYSSDEDDENDE